MAQSKLKRRNCEKSKSDEPKIVRSNRKLSSQQPKKKSTKVKKEVIDALPSIILTRSQAKMAKTLVKKEAGIKTKRQQKKISAEKVYMLFLIICFSFLLNDLTLF